MMTCKNFVRNWLLQQPWVEIDHGEAPATMERLRASIPPHPKAEQRHAARLRRRKAENHGVLTALVHRLRDGYAARRRDP
jgi:hypothetical protein